jgi:hypothetical protein
VSWEHVVEHYTTAAIRYPQGIRSVIFTRNIPQEHFREVSVHVYWGRTGTGKTRRAVEENQDSYYILRNYGGTNVWFDGYNNETTLIIDEFYGWIKFGMLLTYLDGYKTTLPVKGGTMWAHWNKVIITSNCEHRSWYKNITELQWGALERRISEEIYFE